VIFKAEDVPVNESLDGWPRKQRRIQHLAEVFLRCCRL
jgi:hypothetical protein